MRRPTILRSAITREVNGWRWTIRVNGTHTGNRHKLDPTVSSISLLDSAHYSQKIREFSNGHSSETVLVTVSKSTHRTSVSHRRPVKLDLLQHAPRGQRKGSILRFNIPKAYEHSESRSSQTVGCGRTVSTADYRKPALVYRVALSLGVWDSANNHPRISRILKLP